VSDAFNLRRIALTVITIRRIIRVTMSDESEQSSKLIVNQNLPIYVWIERIDSTFNEASDVFADNPDLMNSCRDLRQFAIELVHFASEYQFEDIQANGYWSHLKSGLAVVRYGTKNWPSMAEEDRMKFVILMMALAKGIDYLRIIRQDTVHQKDRLRQGKTKLSN